MNQDNKKAYPNPANEPEKKQAGERPSENPESSTTRPGPLEPHSSTSTANTNVENAKVTIGDTTQTDQRPD